MNKIQCTSMTFIKFEGILNQFWGISKLLHLRFTIKKNKHVEFFKLLGAGSGLGYRAWPKYGVIGVFMVWDEIDEAKAFFHSDRFTNISATSSEQYTVFLQPSSSRGTWSGFGNWRFGSQENGNKGLVCALTRATIKRRYLYDFWKMVPSISMIQKNYPGLIFSQGVGEVPVLEQATFTIWENTQSMEEFAYTTFHGKAIQRVRQANGFKEQMFTRFNPIMSYGTWEGSNLLEKYGVPVMESPIPVAIPVVNSI